MLCGVEVRVDLVRVMAPTGGPPGVALGGLAAPHASARAGFGAAATTAAAITATVASLTDAALKVAPAVMQAIKADQALAKKELVRYAELKKKLASAKDKERILSIKSSMAAAWERAELYKLKALLSAGGKVPQGPRLEGTALEIRRNVLANEWDSATDPAEKKRIETLIADYDRQLITLEYALRATLSEELEAKAREESRRATPAGSSNRPARPTVIWDVLVQNPLESAFLFGLGFVASRVISFANQPD
jgi:hypothetical protein